LKRVSINIPLLTELERDCVGDEIAASFEGKRNHQVQMTLPPNFKEALRSRSDEELCEMFAHSKEYLPEALEAAKAEASRRNLSFEQSASINQTTAPANVEANIPARPFFRWIPTAVALWLMGGIYGLCGVGNILLARHHAREFLIQMHRENQQIIRGLWIGALQNCGIALLCICGWYLMRRRTPPGLIGGASVVAAGLFITVNRSVHWIGSSSNHWPWVEPLLFWPFFLYAIVYGYRESKAAKGKPDGSQMKS
jgi:hypothetical protein